MTASTRQNDLTLVLGGNGKTGRRVVERLRGLGRAVRPVSRTSTPRFDWEDRSTWAAALDGASQAYVTYQPDLAVPGALATVTAFFEQAVQSGVKRLALLSGRGEVEAEDAEQALKDSGADWTILRCSWFSQNFSENFFLDMILAGEVALPVGAVAEPFVDADDIADVATAALTQRGHSGQLHELTGPRAISFAQAVAAIAKATGRNIRFVPITPQDFRAGLEQARLSAVEIDLILYLFRTVLDGRNERVTDGVQRALGRPARDFDDYVRHVAASGVWRA
ncbi:MAG: NAD(P)H-binding protein [Proteobacteria bacterium]|nr:NAD(P)H-binding protein [Pseudomonadota bacterium]MBS0494066.1 NAD(P)H-binding protein [Pseudomonadota bacterium]